MQINGSGAGWLGIGGSNATRGTSASLAGRQMAAVAPPPSKRAALQMNGPFSSSNLADWSFKMLDPGNVGRIANLRNSSVSAA